MYKLSICMMVRDEEKNIKRCLDSVKPLIEAVDTEIIIVDTGSTDKTVDLCSGYTDKIHHHKWNDNFSEMRNVTIEYATGEWLLILDADEEFVTTDALIQFLKKAQPKNIVGAALYLRNISNLEGTSYSAELVTPRIFKNFSGLRYEGSVHNMPVINGELQFVDAVMNHYGYIGQDKDLMEKKYARTRTLLLKELAANPLNPYYLYQLSTTYAMHGDNGEAYAESARAYQIIIHSEESMRNHIYIFSAYAKDALNTGKFQEVLDICKKGIEVEPEYIDLYFFAGTANSALGNTEAAIWNYRQYLDYVSKFDQLRIRYNAAIQHYTLHRQDEANCNMAINYAKNGDYENCYRHAVQIISVLTPDSMYFQGVFKSYQIALMKLSKYEEIVESLDRFRVFDQAIIATIEEESKLLGVAQRERLFEVLSTSGHPYGAIIRLKRAIQAGDPGIKVMAATEVEGLDLGNCPSYVYDVLYYAMKYDISIAKILHNLTEERAMEVVGELDERFDDFSDVVKRYLELYNGQDFVSYNEQRILFKYRMFRNIKRPTEEESVAAYLKMAKIYIYAKYTEEFIRSANMYSGKSNEESYLLMLFHEMDQEMSSERVKRYEDITKLFPDMECVTRYVLKRYITTDEQDELFAALMTQINVLVGNEKYEEAISIIDHYLQIHPGNMEMIFLKSNIMVKSTLH